MIFYILYTFFFISLTTKGLSIAPQGSFSKNSRKTSKNEEIFTNESDEPSLKKLIDTPEEDDLEQNFDNFNCENFCTELKKVAPLQFEILLQIVINAQKMKDKAKEEYKEELISLKMTIKEHEENEQQLSFRISQIKKENTFLCKENEKLQEESISNEHEKKELEKRLKHLKAYFHQKSEEQSFSNKQLTIELNDTQKKQEEQTKKQEKIITNLQQQCKSLQQETEELQKGIEEKQEEYDTCLNHFKILEKYIQKKEKKLKKLEEKEDEILILKEKIKKLLNNNKKLSSHLKDQNDLLKVKPSTSNRFKNISPRKRKATLSGKNELSLHEELIIATSKLPNQKKEIKDLKKELESLKENNEDLKKEIEDFKIIQKRLSEYIKKQTVDKTRKRFYFGNKSALYKRNINLSNKHLIVFKVKKKQKNQPQNFDDNLEEDIHKMIQKIMSGQSTHTKEAPSENHETANEIKSSSSKKSSLSSQSSFSPNHSLSNYSNYNFLKSA